jgi:LysR family positive regulator for ilvC
VLRVEDHVVGGAVLDHVAVVQDRDDQAGDGLPDPVAPSARAVADGASTLRLDLRTGDAAAALARLAEGEVDAAVAGIPKRLPQTMVTRTVAVTDLVLVRARESTADTGPYVVPAGGLVRAAAFRWFRRSGVKPTIAAEPDRA